MLRAPILALAACASTATPPTVLQATAPPPPVQHLVYARVGDRGPVIEITADGPDAAARALCELLVRRSGTGVVRVCGRDRLPPRAPAIELVERSTVTPSDVVLERVRAHVDRESLEGATATVDARTPFPDRAQCELALAAARDERARAAHDTEHAMREIRARGLTYQQNRRDEHCGKIRETANRCATIADPYERRPCEAARDDLVRQCAEDNTRIAELEEHLSHPLPPSPDRSELRCVAPAAPG